MCVEGAPQVSCEDGRWILNNGKHIVAALQGILQEMPLEKIQEEDWCVPELLATFSEGLYVDYVAYTTEDKEAQALSSNSHLYFHAQPLSCVAAVGKHFTLLGGVSPSFPLSCP